MRKTLVVTMNREDRDKGKRFLITEWPAKVAEQWATEAILALQRGGIDIPEGAGFVGIAAAGYKMIGGMSVPEVLGLSDRLMKCVQIMPNPTDPNVVRALVDNGAEGDDVEEVVTRLQLKGDVFALHAGFTSAADLLTSISERMAAAALLNTRTSRGSSAPSSQAD